MSQRKGHVAVSNASCAIQDVEIASGLLCRLEDLEAGRRQQRVIDVRPSVARRIGVSSGTLENIRKGRRKIIPSWLLGSIRRVLVDVLQSELRALEHEIGITKQIGLDHHSSAVAETEALLAKAKALLEDAAR